MSPSPSGRGSTAAPATGRRAPPISNRWPANRRHRAPGSSTSTSTSSAWTRPKSSAPSSGWPEWCRGASGLPLSIDSSNPDILKAGLGACDRRRGQPLVNSVSLERASTIAAAAGARVVASAAGATALPETVEERLANVAELMPMLERHGFARGDIYLDPLVLPVSVNGANGAAVLDTIAALREAYGPEIHFAPGLSNVSFGLPKRALVNQVFAVLCRRRGCDGGIADPLQINDRALDALDPASAPFRLAENLLLGRDEFGMDYIAASRDGAL